MNIFITGISSGIGEELARQLVRAGHRVWGVARRRELLEKLQRELISGKLRTSVCDVADTASCQLVAGEMAAAGFIPDVAVLNAGVYEHDVEEGLDIERFRKSFDSNVTGALVWVSMFLPLFQKRVGGQFVAISSTAALRPGYGSVSYPATKAALSMAFRGLRLNYASTPLQFTTIHFGPIDTRLWSGTLSFLVPSAQQAAGYIIKRIGGRGGDYFFPFLSTSLLRLSLCLPDRVFSFVGSFLKKKRL